MRPIVYVTGVLIAADRGERLIWAEHRLRLEAGIVPIVPSPVVAQASRTPRQVQMRRLLRGCEVVPLGEADAHRAGALLAKSRTSDVVDAVVVVVGIERKADVQTGDTVVLSLDDAALHSPEALTFAARAAARAAWAAAGGRGEARDQRLTLLVNHPSDR